jgi:cytidine kinase
MSLLVTGSIGIDTIETPTGRRDDVIGGSAVYFALAASYFTPVRVVGVVGEDCPRELLKVFEGREINTAGLEVRKGSKTFRWHGKYHEDINNRDTVRVDLNVLGERGPQIPSSFCDSKFVFLANTHPALQMQLLKCLQSPRLVVCDTMDLWIETTRNELCDLLKHVTGIVMNDSEAKQLTGKTNLLIAARATLNMGPQFVVIKKGEHGCLLVAGDGEVFTLPAYPTEKVTDPTGAGDSFAGGMMGYLATQRSYTPTTIKRALAFGTVMASYAIEDYSISALVAATPDGVDRRWNDLKMAMTF